jgi:hypothetical protein
MPDNPNSSGTANWQLNISEVILDSFERVDASRFAPTSLEVQHLQSARRSANIILQDISANRGINLWAIGDSPIITPLQPGISNYVLPENTVDLWDSYIRILTPGPSITLGVALTPLLDVGGVPIVDSNGIPQIVGPSSGTLSCGSGSNVIVVRWPGHGLVAGSPAFFMVRPSIGAIPLDEFVLVTDVVDSDNFTFTAQTSAALDELGTGLTPLLATTGGSAILTVYLASHGLSQGQNFNVEVGTEVGSFMVPAGSYEILSVPTPYSFTINPNAGIAAGTTAAFENDGQFVLATQAAGDMPTDIFLWPISRNDWAMLPNKFAPGRPTSYWYNRTIIPSINLWPVPPGFGFGRQFYQFQGYRTRALQDFDLSGTQAPDLPKRFYQAFVSELAAALAEKHNPAAWPAKQAAAAAAWGRAAASDVEHVTTSITPDLTAFFN